MALSCALACFHLSRKPEETGLPSTGPGAGPSSKRSVTGPFDDVKRTGSYGRYQSGRRDSNLGSLRSPRGAGCARPSACGGNASRPPPEGLRLGLPARHPRSKVRITGRVRPDKAGGRSAPPGLVWSGRKDSNLGSLGSPRGAGLRAAVRLRRHASGPPTGGPPARPTRAPSPDRRFESSGESDQPTPEGAPHPPALSGRGERIRTFDPLLPKQMRYQAAPRPDGPSV